MVLGFVLPRYERPTLRGNGAEACLIVECGSWRGESGTHDVGPREHKLDGALIHSQLLHHVGVLMQKLQSWEPLSIPIAEEKRCVVQNQQLRPIWTAEHMGASASGPLAGHVFDISSDWLSMVPALRASRNFPPNA